MNMEDADIVLDSFSSVLVEMENFFLRNQSITCKPKELFAILRILLRRSKELPAMTVGDLNFIINYQLEKNRKEEERDYSHYFFSRLPTTQIMEK